jgi:hypothetical protein
MRIPGFTGEVSLIAGAGVYTGRLRSPRSISSGIVPQLPIGVGPTNGRCCCSSDGWGGGTIFSQALRFAPGFGRFGWGATETCVDCPEGTGCVCGCSDGTPICVCSA